MDSIVQTTKTYELYLHYKQGDDFREQLDDADSDIPKALRSWAESLRANVEHCEKLADAFEREISDGAKIQVEADNHYIGFYGDEGVLQRLADEKLLNCYVHEDE